MSEERRSADSGKVTADPPGTFLRAFSAPAERSPRSAPAVWMMRQAGRYLPEYQVLRARHSFVEMCTTPEIAVEVSLQPLRRFAFDAAIVFYDILFLPEAMGAPLEFTDRGPAFLRPLRSREDIDALRVPDVLADDPKAGTGAILRSLELLRGEVPPEVAVLGFAGAPFTLAAYLVEGSFGRNGDRVRRMLNDEPAALHALLERLTVATCEYLKAQVDAGADAVQLFDTWAGLLDRRAYDEFALPYHRRIFAAVRAAGAASILYVNGSAHLLESLAASGASALSIDWRQDLREARDRVGPELVLQGNLDPARLFAAPAEVRQSVAHAMAGMGEDPRYVFNLGHGILPETPVASVEAMVEAVRSDARASSSDE